MNFLVGCISIVIVISLCAACPILTPVFIVIGIAVWVSKANKQAVMDQTSQVGTTSTAKTPGSPLKSSILAEPMHWIGSGQHIVGNYPINNPLAYFCKGSRSALDASCIDTSLPIGSPISEPKGMLGYWPSYARLTPAQRANYLAWMAGGRQTPIGDIGYAFIFFYGLERRILIDKSDVVPIIKEVVRLLNIYMFSGSFNSYLKHFVAYTICRSGIERLNEASFQYAFVDNLTSWNSEIASVALAWFFVHGKSLPSKCAYLFAKQDPRFPQSTVIQRLPDQFETLFYKKYKEKFGDGILLRCAKRPLSFGYHPASATLLQTNDSSIVRPVEIPDVQGIPSQFKPLLDIWTSCIDELRPLSRKVAKGVEVTTREAYDSLPDALKAEVDHPDKDKWIAVATQNLLKNGMTLVPLAALAKLCDFEERPKLTQKQSEDLAITASNIGYSMVPDSRITGRPYGWDDPVCLFRPDGEPSLPVGNTYHSASVILELGVAVAAADGTIHDDEINHITQFLENQFVLEPSDTIRLDAYKEVLVSQPPSLPKISKRLQAVLSAKQRESLGQFLVGITAANGVIDRQELSTLKTAFKALGIDAGKLEIIIESLHASDQPVEIRCGSKSSRAGESIPARISQSAQPVSIDAGVVQRILQETAEVAQMLSEVMGDAGADTIELEEQTQPSNIPSPLQVGTDSDQILASLDTKYHAVFFELLGNTEWRKSDFEVLARQHGLMPSGMLDAINSWADENLEDFLIEEGDPYIINIHLTEGKI